MFTQKIAAIYLQLMSWVLLVIAAVLLLVVLHKTFSSTPEWYAFGILLILPLALMFFLFATGVVAGTAMLRKELLRGNQGARLLAIFLIALTAYLHFPILAIAGLIPLASLVFGWKEGLLDDEEEIRLTETSITPLSASGEPRSSLPKCDVCGCVYDVHEQSGRVGVCKWCDNAKEIAQKLKVSPGHAGGRVCTRCGEGLAVDFSKNQSNVCSLCALGR